MSASCSTEQLNTAMDSVSLSAVPAGKEKPKRKNSEKRKEKSRKAARERRSQESKIFDQIEDILPVSSKTLEHLDKASLVRVAINYLKIRSVVDPLKAPDIKDAFDLSECSATNTLNGFVFVLSKDGDLIYLSENVERHLGLTHIDLMGQSIYDYSHPCDHDDIKLFLEPLTSAFNASKYLPKPEERSQKAPNAMGESTGPFFIRMKCTLTNKGRNCNLKSANFKVVKCTGRMVDLETVDPVNAQLIGENFRQYMVAVAELIQHPSRIEIPQTAVFMSKHSPDLKFTYADESIEQLFGFNAADLIGTSFYKYFDASDFKLMSDFFKTLFAKGQCDSGYYKLLVKTGGYRWISTQATVITEPNSNQPQSIILINRVISGVENAHLITSDVQQASEASTTTTSVPSCVTFEPVPLCEPISATASVIQPKSTIYQLEAEDSVQVPVLTNPVPPQQQTPLKADIEEQLNQLASQLCAPSTENCISSTATVLAPKTADMESGFLMFTDDNTGMTVLTDADDLTHLAPDAGDLCVPMLSDMDFNDLSLFDDIFLNSTSFNMSGANLEDDLLNNLATFEGDKLKLDNFDTLNIEPESNLKKYDSSSMLSLNGKELPEMKSTNFDQYPLANDPFLYQNDELLMSSSPITPSSGSLSDPYSSSSNSPTGSPSSRMTQFSPKSSSSGDEMSDRNLCDTTDFSEDKDLEMRAPFIPIDDDFLLNDFPYSDSNMDDLFSWISGNRGKSSEASFSVNDASSQNKQSTSSSISVSGKSAGTGGCLEALLQNDELVCNLKNKMYNSNQLLNRTSVATATSGGTVSANNAAGNTSTSNNTGQQQQQQLQQQSTSTFAPMSTPTPSTPLKRKNSNILIYTTVNTGDGKKFKNLVLSTDSLGAAKLNDKSTVHHFVLTKNNELIPTQLQQSFKVSSKRVLPLESDLSSMGANMTQTVARDCFSKEDLLFKKARQEPDKSYSNSVLLNLLVNGADLPNGYEIAMNHHPYQGKMCNM